MNSSLRLVGVLIFYTGTFDLIFTLYDLCQWYWFDSALAIVGKIQFFYRMEKNNTLDPCSETHIVVWYYDQTLGSDLSLWRWTYIGSDCKSFLC